MFKLGVGFMICMMMLLVTEGGKRVGSYWKLLTEDEGVSLVRHVEFYYEKLIIPRGVQFKEGICRREFLASEVREDDFEAGAFTHLGKDMLAVSFLKSFIDFRNGEADFESKCNGVLIEIVIFKAFHKKFEKIRVVAWLKFVLYMFGAAAKPMENELSLEPNGVEGEVVFSGCSDEIVLSYCLNIECKKGVKFGLCTPISSKCLIRVVQHYKQPTKSSAKSSVFSLGFSKSSIL
jgi:hypothetical protein